jgi:PAS domain S-box-containing protein
VPYTLKEARFYSWMLGIAGAVYLAWWFAVKAILPTAFNPLPSRLGVVGYFLAALLATVAFPALRRRAEILFYVGACYLLAHYFYLFHNNASDINWVVGAYLVVFVLSVGIQSSAWLKVFLALALGLGVSVWALDPVLRETIFLPGLVTIVLLCVAVLTGRIRMLRELMDSISRYQSLLDATFEGVAVHDLGRIIDTNATFAALFRYSPEALTGKTVNELVAPESRAYVEEQIRLPENRRYECLCIRSDGTRFPVEISSKPHMYRGRMLRLAAVRDLSDVKLAEQEKLALLQEQNARAAMEESLRLRDEFISIAAHELRTPLTSLQLQLETFSRGQSLEDYSVRARRQLVRLNRLIEALLDVSRFEEGMLSLQPEELDLSALAREVVDTLVEDLARAGCKLELKSSGELRGRWDPLRLEQVFTNLLRNAMTYGAGKPIELELEGQGSQVRLRIHDHGIGIDPANQERVFRRFERAVSDRHYGGLGLGLYISRQIVEAHRGTLTVRSQSGEGAVFEVTLPISTGS